MPAMWWGWVRINEHSFSFPWPLCFSPIGSFSSNHAATSFILSLSIGRESWTLYCMGCDQPRCSYTLCILVIYCCSHKWLYGYVCMCVCIAVCIYVWMYVYVMLWCIDKSAWPVTWRVLAPGFEPRPRQLLCRGPWVSSLHAIALQCHCICAAEASKCTSELCVRKEEGRYLRSVVLYCIVDMDPVYLWIMHLSMYAGIRLCFYTRVYVCVYVYIYNYVWCVWWMYVCKRVTCVHWSWLDFGLCFGLCVASAVFRVSSEPEFQGHTKPSRGYYDSDTGRRIGLIVCTFRPVGLIIIIIIINIIVIIIIVIIIIIIIFIIISSSRIIVIIIIFIIIIISAAIVFNYSLLPAAWVWTNASCV